MHSPKRDENAVIIFARWPELGTCKTRIAADTNPGFALEFSMACLTDLILNLRGSEYYELLVGVNTPEELACFEERFAVSGILTEGATQSDRFDSVFSRLLSAEGYRKAVLIPMDLPFLSPQDMTSALALLDQFPFAHGSESNGGIYLIGVRAPYEQNVFQGVRWSTPFSFSDLVRTCGHENVGFLKQRDDLNSFKAVLDARRGIAHHCHTLFELLVKEGYYLPDDRYVDFDALPISIPVVTAVVQRVGPDGLEVLLQTRWKPGTDSTYTGTLELPSGLVQKHEPAQLAVVREVREETGLEVDVMPSHLESHLVLQTHYGPHSDTAIAYAPFCCTQQTTGGRAYIGLVFLCRVIRGELRPYSKESVDPRWVRLDELEELLRKGSKDIFTLDVPALRLYTDYARAHPKVLDAVSKGV